ncbi:hypothetical protein HYH03_003682 [Edaphochlamys debaryana]|uniref:Ubiquitin-like protease family profile domain-containing protein n=1 Tax=Edaphochlamys debaryana TaxID=47281 RepID=A0A835YIS9_9CHLO|nr:hypothetical protein HYH03_003682 [Edaphochlamys debaryana]|eukprot:KAG2498424.1 hypothetical protein HYH03_003682 [Edaphochlamys debaryana]
MPRCDVEGCKLAGEPRARRLKCCGKDVLEQCIESRGVVAGDRFTLLQRAWNNDAVVSKNCLSATNGGPFFFHPECLGRDPGSKNNVTWYVDEEIKVDGAPQQRKVKDVRHRACDLCLREVTGEVAYQNSDLNEEERQSLKDARGRRVASKDKKQAEKKTAKAAVGGAEGTREAAVAGAAKVRQGGGKRRHAEEDVQASSSSDEEDPRPPARRRRQRPPSIRQASCPLPKSLDELRLAVAAKQHILWRCTEMVEVLKSLGRSTMGKKAALIARLGLWAFRYLRRRGLAQREARLRRGPRAPQHRSPPRQPSNRQQGGPRPASEQGGRRAEADGAPEAGPASAGGQAPPGPSGAAAPLAPSPTQQQGGPRPASEQGKRRAEADGAPEAGPASAGGQAPPGPSGATARLAPSQTRQRGGRRPAVGQGQRRAEADAAPPAGGGGVAAMSRRPRLFGGPNALPGHQQGSVAVTSVAGPGSSTVAAAPPRAAPPPSHMNGDDIWHFNRQLGEMVDRLADKEDARPRRRRKRPTLREKLHKDWDGTYGDRLEREAEAEAETEDMDVEEEERPYNPPTFLEETEDDDEEDLQLLGGAGAAAPSRCPVPLDGQQAAFPAAAGTQGANTAAAPSPPCIASPGLHRRGCNTCWHMHCLEMLPYAPPGDWQCPPCSGDVRLWPVAEGGPPSLNTRLRITETWITVMGGGGDDDALVNSPTAYPVMRRRVLRTMYDGQQVHADCIDYFMVLLQARDARLRGRPSIPSCHFFSCYFYNQLFGDTGQYEYSKVARWTREQSLRYNKQATPEVSVLQLQRVFIPIWRQEGLVKHYVSAVVDPAAKVIHLYDSAAKCKTNLAQIGENLLKWVQDEAAARQLDQGSANWRYDTPPVVQQVDEDCGIFTMLFAYLVGRGLPIPPLGAAVEARLLRQSFTYMMMTQWVV